MHDREWFTSIETQPGVERKRSVVESRLNEPDTREVSFAHTIKYGLHQFASDAAILRLRIYGDRPDTGNGRALIQTVTADNSTVGFRNNAVEDWMGKHPGQYSNRYVGRRYVRREVVIVVNVVERVVTNLAAYLCILRLRASDVDRGGIARDGGCGN